MGVFDLVTHNDMCRCRSISHFRHRLRGVTLLELMVVVAIATILMMVAAPSFTALMNTQRANSAATTLLNGMNFARNEAIKRNVRVVLCKSATSSACTNSGLWSQGWIVFQDTNNNAQVDTGEAVLMQQGTAAQGVSITGNQNIADYVSYSASGTAKLLSGAMQAGTFTICTTPAQTDSVNQLVLNTTGRPRLDKAAATACPVS